MTHDRCISILVGLITVIVLLSIVLVGTFLFNNDFEESFQVSANDFIEDTESSRKDEEPQKDINESMIPKEDTSQNHLLEQIDLRTPKPKEEQIQQEEQKEEIAQIVDLRRKEDVVDLRTKNNRIENYVFIGDSIFCGLKQSGEIGDVFFRAVVSSSPGHWNKDKSVNGDLTYSTLPQDSDSIDGVCIMLGSNNPWEISEMKKLLEKICLRYPEKNIYVLKILPQPNKPSETRSQITKYNNAIKEYCNGIDYLMFVDATIGVDLSDGVHPNQEGYRNLANNIRDAIFA